MTVAPPLLVLDAAEEIVSDEKISDIDHDVLAFIFRPMRTDSNQPINDRTIRWNI